MKKTYSFLIILLIMAFQGLTAQEFAHAVGFRAGASSGIAYRQMLSSDVSAEWMLVSQRQATVLVFLLEKHVPAVLFDNIPMTFIYGGGLHAGLGHSNRTYFYDQYTDNTYTKGSLSPFRLGLDGFAALEYQFQPFPVSVSLECKPYFEFFDNRFPGLHLPSVAVGARYTF